MHSETPSRGGNRWPPCGAKGTAAEPKRKPLNNHHRPQVGHTIAIIKPTPFPSADPYSKNDARKRGTAQRAAIIQHGYEVFLGPRDDRERSTSP